MSLIVRVRCSIDSCLEHWSQPRDCVGQAVRSRKDLPHRGKSGLRADPQVDVAIPEECFEFWPSPVDAKALSRRRTTWPTSYDINERRDGLRAEAWQG